MPIFLLLPSMVAFQFLLYDCKRDLLDLIAKIIFPLNGQFCAFLHEEKSYYFDIPCQGALSVVIEF